MRHHVSMSRENVSITGGEDVFAAIYIGRYLQGRAMPPSPWPDNWSILTIEATRNRPWNLKIGWDPSPAKEKFLPTPLFTSNFICFVLLRCDAGFCSVSVIEVDVVIRWQMRM